MPASELPAVPPPFIVRWSSAIARWLEYVARRLAPPQFATTQLAHQRWLSDALGAFLRLGLPGALSDGPRTVDDLARALDVDRDGLGRLLRALAREGLLHELDGQRFASTPWTDVLRADHPHSVHHVVANATAAHNTATWARLDAAVRSGRRVWEDLHGDDMWTWLDRHPEHGAVFHGAMAELTRDAAPAVARAYDFGRHAVIADLAGGSGTLLAVILAANPGLRGVLADRDAVVADATAVFQRWGVSDRATHVAADVFQRVPPGCDALVAKHLLHGYDDDHAAGVLAVWRAALPPHGRLLLVECVVPGPGRPFLAMLDLQMLLTSFGGRERTEAEWDALLARGGFARVATHETATPFAVIEARPT